MEVIQVELYSAHELEPEALAAAHESYLLSGYAWAWAEDSYNSIVTIGEALGVNVTSVIWDPPRLRYTLPDEEHIVIASRRLRDALGRMTRPRVFRHNGKERRPRIFTEVDEPTGYCLDCTGIEAMQAEYRKALADRGYDFERAVKTILDAMLKDGCEDREHSLTVEAFLEEADSDECLYLKDGTYWRRGSQAA